MPFFLSWTDCVNEDLASVFVYQVRPRSTLPGWTARTSESNGSRAFGQPVDGRVCHVPIMSGCPKSVPPSRTDTTEPSPV